MCCVHGNTFFPPSTNSRCSGQLYMLSIEFYRSHASGNPNAYNYRPATTGLVRRVVCLPFPVAQNDDDAIINVTVANTGSPCLAFARAENSHTILASDMHVLDVVIRDMCKITLESITPATTQSKAYLQVRRFLIPTPHHICGLVRVCGHKCVISPLAMPMLSKGTTNINKGYVVSSTICQVRRLEEGERKLEEASSGSSSGHPRWACLAS